MCFSLQGNHSLLMQLHVQHLAICSLSNKKTQILFHLPPLLSFLNPVCNFSFGTITVGACRVQLAGLSAECTSLCLYSVLHCGTIVEKVDDRKAVCPSPWPMQDCWQSLFLILLQHRSEDVHIRKLFPPEQQPKCQLHFGEYLALKCFALHLCEKLLKSFCLAAKEVCIVVFVIFQQFSYNFLSFSGQRPGQTDKCVLCAKQESVEIKLFLSMEEVALGNRTPGKKPKCNYFHLKMKGETSVQGLEI